MSYNNNNNQHRCSWIFVFINFYMFFSWLPLFHKNHISIESMLLVLLMLLLLLLELFVFLVWAHSPTATTYHFCLSVGRLVWFGSVRIQWIIHTLYCFLYCDWLLRIKCFNYSVLMEIFMSWKSYLEHYWLWLWLWHLLLFTLKLIGFLKKC